MDILHHITVGEVILAYLTCCVIHEGCIAFLPDEVAGPGGWLIDTSDRA